MGEPEALLDRRRNEPDRSVEPGRNTAQSVDLERTGPSQGHRSGPDRRLHVLDRLGPEAQDRTGRNGRNAAVHHRRQQFDVAQRIGHRSRR